MAGCSVNWIKTKATQIVEEKHSEDVFSASHGWFCRFLKLFNPVDTSNWKSILGPERVQTVEYVHRAKNHEKSAQNRFL